MKLCFLDRDLEFTDKNLVQTINDILAKYSTCNKLVIRPIRNMKTYTSIIEYRFINKESNTILYTERFHIIDLLTDSLTDILNELNRERRFISKYCTQIKYMNILNQVSSDEFNKQLKIKFISFDNEELVVQINGKVYTFSAKYHYLCKKDQLSNKTCDSFWFIETTPQGKLWKISGSYLMPAFPNSLKKYLPELIYVLNANVPLN